MSALHVFDMDGTLLRGTTANLQISRRLDRLAPMQELEDRFAAGELDEAGLATELTRLWHDLDQDLVDEVAAGAPWIGGMDEVFADIRARGESSMLITMSPEFFARHLLGRGVDVVRGAAYPTLPFGSTVLDPAGLLTPADKVHLADAERARHGLATNACVAYGDSTSDEPLFAHLDNTVAVNAGERVEALARAAYRGDDLRDAYARGRSLLDTAGAILPS